MTELFVDLADRGVRLCTERAGDGLPLLVLNGTGSDLRNKPNALSWPISGDFDVIAYDHRGLGRSEQYDEGYQPSMADFADDALALCSHFGIEEFAVIGISFGGMVAQEVAIRGGERIRRLSLCCTSSGGDGRASYPLHEVYADGSTIDDKLELWDTRAATDESVATWLDQLMSGRKRSSTPPPGLLRQLEARRHHDTWSRLAEITAPTQIAYGRYDAVAPPANSENLASRIPDARLAPFDGGHLFLWQDPAAWPAIGDFLGDSSI